MEGQYQGEITGQILEAVGQGRLLVESLTTSLQLRSDLTNDEQVSVNEAIAILQSCCQSGQPGW